MRPLQRQEIAGGLGLLEKDGSISFRKLAREDDLTEVVQERRSKRLLCLLRLADQPARDACGGDRATLHPFEEGAVDHAGAEREHMSREHDSAQKLQAEQHDRSSNRTDLGGRAKVGRVGELEDLCSAGRVLLDDRRDIGNVSVRIFNRAGQPREDGRRARKVMILPSSARSAGSWSKRRCAQALAITDLSRSVVQGLDMNWCAIGTPRDTPVGAA